MLMLTDPYRRQGLKFVLLVAGPASTLLVVIVAVFAAARHVRRRRHSAAALCVVLAAWTIASWWFASPLAQRWSGWSDPDGDGMFADTEQGAFDSFDFYSGHWGAIVLGCAVVAGAAIAAIELAVRRSER